jgi:hypothetical protein
LQLAPSDVALVPSLGRPCRCTRLIFSAATGVFFCLRLPIKGRQTKAAAIVIKHPFTGQIKQEKTKVGDRYVFAWQNE